jgi:hypothetical protein
MGMFDGPLSLSLAPLSGSGVANQVAYWSSASQLTGQAGFEYDPGLATLEVDLLVLQGAANPAPGHYIQAGGTDALYTSFSSGFGLDGSAGVHIDFAASSGNPNVYPLSCFVASNQVNTYPRIGMYRTRGTTVASLASPAAGDVPIDKDGLFALEIGSWDDTAWQTGEPWLIQAVGTWDNATTNAGYDMRFRVRPYQGASEINALSLFNDGLVTTYGGYQSNAGGLSTTAGNSTMFDSGGDGLVLADVVNTRVLLGSLSSTEAAMATVYKRTSPAEIGFIVRGAASNTANHLELRDAAGAGMSAFDDTGWLGILNVAPSTPLAVGATSQFRVDASGDLVRINNVPYTWPAADAAGALNSDGAGTLSWAAPTPAAHNLLSAQHGDTAVQGATQGSIVYADATPAWNELVANATGTNMFLRSVSGGIPAWAQVDYADLSGTAPVTSVFTRTGAVVAQANDYTWAQIDMTVSDIADITTRAHASLTGIGTNTHAQVDTHIADGTIHFVQGAIDHTAITNIGTNSHAAIDLHIADGTLHFTEASIDHGAIAGLGDDDHTQYILADGTRAFSAYIDIDEAAVPATPAANVMRIYAESFHGFPFLTFQDDGGVVRRFVRDSVFVGYNNRGTTIAAGRIVYATGAFGDVPTLDTAQANASATMPAIGVTIESIANNSYGRVMQVGLLENVNTAAYTTGDVLYVSATTPGVPTVTAPLWPNLRQEIGTVLVADATVGAIQLVARTVQNDGVIDHGGLLGLVDDDHTQYLLLAGRAGGQTAYGGTATSDDLTLWANNNTFAAANTGRIVLENRLEWATAWAMSYALSTHLIRDSRSYTLGTNSTWSNGAPTGFYFQPELNYAFPLLLSVIPAFWSQPRFRPSHTGSDVAGYAEGFRAEPSMHSSNGAGTCTAAQITGYAAYPRVRTDGVGAMTIPSFSWFKAGSEVNAAAGGAQNFSEGTGVLTVTAARGFWMENPSIAGTPVVTELAGVDLANLTRGTTNLSLRSAGAAVEMRHAGPGVFGANAAPTNASVGLEVQSTTRAFLAPRMTTTQRNALTAVNGMIIYNTTTNQMQGYINSAWAAM